MIYLHYIIALHICQPFSFFTNIIHIAFVNDSNGNKVSVLQKRNDLFGKQSVSEKSLPSRWKNFAEKHKSTDMDANFFLVLKNFSLRTLTAADFSDGV